jgi:hypothetical protein
MPTDRPARRDLVGQQRRQGARGGAGVALGGDGEQRAREIVEPVARARDVDGAELGRDGEQRLARRRAAGGVDQALERPGLVAPNASHDRGSVNSDRRYQNS